MNVPEGFEKEVAIAKEVSKRREALGAIISVERLRDELLTSMLKAGAMIGGVGFLMGLLAMYDGRVSFPGVVAVSLVAFIGGVVWYIGATTAFEDALDREIRRRMRQQAWSAAR
jgi:hypothetical protein